VPISYLGSRLYELQGMFWAGVLANTFTAFVAFYWFKYTLNNMTQLHNATVSQETA
jgi:uncharacterized membrane protein YfbV (UPF0208 family)